MKVTEIYTKYKLPPNLRQHLLRVGSLADFVTNHWESDDLSREVLLKAALFHDLGSIVKFNFDSPSLPGSEAKNIDYWRQVKREMIEKYGTTNEHVATEAMCKEVGLPQASIFVVANCGFSNYEEIVASNNWQLKVCTYCDHRTSPQGIIALRDRLREVINRYTREGRKTAHTSVKADFLVSLALEVE